MLKDIDTIITNVEEEVENNNDEVFITQFNKYHERIVKGLPIELPKETPKETTSEMTSSVDSEVSFKDSPEVSQELLKQPAWKTKANVKKEQSKSAEGTCNLEKDGKTIKVESVKNEKPISKEDLNKFMKDFSDNLLKSVESVKVSEVSFDESTAEYAFNFLTRPLFVPKDQYELFTAAKFVSDITKKHYNPYDSPDKQLQHDLASTCAIILRLNKTFNYTFMNLEDGIKTPLYQDLERSIVKYLKLHEESPTTAIEYMLIKSFLGKLILALTTSTESAFRSNSEIYLNNTFKKAIMNDIMQLDNMQKHTGKTFKSWQHFLEQLFDMVGEKQMYVHKDYETLNNLLTNAYTVDYMTECLLANILKAVTPPIALNYFFAVKYMYLICRLFGVYLSEGLCKNKSIEEIMSDLKIIVSVGTVLYESRDYILKRSARSMPKDMCKEVQLYYLSHILTGPQYYLLKTFEEYFPSIAYKLMNTSKVNTKDNKNIE